MGGNQPAVTGQAPDFDDSINGIALKSLYYPCVATVVRQFAWDCARQTAALSPSGNVAPYPWRYEYLYPVNAVEVLQLMPAPANDDLNNPLPINYVIANNVVGGLQQRVVQTSLANALAVFTVTPLENAWDALLREAIVRLLASELVMATGGKPDVSDVMLKSGAAFEQIGQSRQD